MKTRNWLVLLLILCHLLLAGCSEPAPQPEAPTADTSAGPAETAAATDPTQPEEPTQPALDDASLVSLRQAMIETPQLFAVAYFGYHETVDSDQPVDPYEIMVEYAPGLCSDLPFLLDIPADSVIGSSGDLFCIVPLDESAAVTVTRGVWDEKAEQYRYGESVYSGESGGPILLFCNNAGWEPDVQLCISGPSGEVVWYPQADDNLCAMPLRNDNWDNLFMDFSSYRETLLKMHRDMKGEWVQPTAEMLRGSTWHWNSFLKDGREVSYQVSFREDTLSVRWNDGFDAEDHVYQDAQWELTYEEDFAVLSIDFREMAGVLRYNLLYHEVYEQLYVALDAVREDIPAGWEPLYRFLTPPALPEPVEMLGFWELEWTEIEGYREAAKPGVENISVFLNDWNSIRLTYANHVFYTDNVYDKEVVFYEGELYPGCGNSRWAAYLSDMEGDVAYSFTLTDHDTLLMRLYWENDEGGPAVTHKQFRRVSEYE